MKKIALVFSGGALRGFAQFGCVKAIEEFCKKESLEIDTVVGTSFGTITSSLIALGYRSKEMIDYSLKTGFNVSNLRDIMLFGPAVLKGKKINRELTKFIGYKTFEETKINIIINSVDIYSGKEYIFTNKGIFTSDRKTHVASGIRILDGIKASTAIPLIFKPVRLGKLSLVDGGLVSAMALHLIDPYDFDMVIAVDVCMANFSFIEKKQNLRRLDMIKQSISVMQRQFHFKEVDEHMKKYGNIVLIRPKVGPAKIKNKGEMKRLIKVGYTETKKVLGQL
ncbi:MAG: patatin-like phospholipase family protein [Candidatus Woesearchaeota archaeon]